MENALIVDDEKHWRSIYEASVRGAGIQSVCFATSLTEAEQAIEAIRFAVAVIDIGLDTADETNVDGLSVMAKLKALGDGTGIIVITGRSGPDVIEYVSDSIHKYEATATFAKGKLDSKLLHDAVKNAQRIYRENSARQETSVRDALHDGVDQMVWDYAMMQALGIRGGAGAFYDFLEKLLREYLPLISSRDGQVIGMDLVSGVAHGAFWSRGVGEALVVSMGQRSAVEQAENAASSSGRLHGRYNVGKILDEHAVGTSMGIVHGLIGWGRADFGGAGG